ncbi:allatostatin-A receptor-like [Montipora capricornis]|uniref:allatostatin-A receptor-like n=1 Tax=Montipora capricornis TaxID=246305 RepID=UPI0035F1139A
MNNSTAAHPANFSWPACSTIVSTMFTIGLSVLSSATIVGNMLIFLTFLKTRNLRTSTNYYIVNMAISDFLCPFFNWPLYASEGMLTPDILVNEPLATFACKLGMYFRLVSQGVSMLSLVLIALDRFIAIVYPFKGILLNVKIRVAFLLMSWLIPVACVLPYALFAGTIKVENHTFCRFLISDVGNGRTVYNGVSIIFSYLIPLISVTGLYFMIIRALKNRPPPGNLLKNRVNADHKRQQQNKRILKILISIVLTFFLCWTPLCTYLFLKKFYPSVFPADRCLLLIGFAFYICPSCSTAANPIILFVFSTNYNQALKNVLLPMFSCKFGSKVVIRKQSRAMATQLKNLEMTNTKVLD